MQKNRTDGDAIASPRKRKAGRDRHCFGPDRSLPFAGYKLWNRATVRIRISDLSEEGQTKDKNFYSSRFRPSLSSEAGGKKRLF
jgi:hypothetical protein